MLNKTTEKTLENFGQQKVKQLKAKAARLSVTGTMAEGYRHEVKGGLTIFGVHYLQWAETGRGPTRSGAKKGNPTLQQSILLWLRIKNLPLFRNKKGQYLSRVAMSYMISGKIHREGTKLWRDKKTRDVYSSIVTQSEVEKLMKKISGDYIIETQSDLLKAFNVLLANRTAA